MEFVEAVNHYLSDLRELLNELRFEITVHSEKILSDQHLAVDVRAGADSHHGDAYGFNERL